MMRQAHTWFANGFSSWACHSQNSRSWASTLKAKTELLETQSILLACGCHSKIDRQRG